MNAIQEIIRHVPQHWVGDGFPVRTLFSYAQGNRFDPFLLLDFAGPHYFAPATAPRGVEQHPHRGFETVTLVYQGELEHRDSTGSQGTIGAGDVQWMTAASGVVHEEFHSRRFTREGGTLEMVQLWVNLPAKDKMSQPGYQSIVASSVPHVELAPGLVTARIIAGELHGNKGPARTHSPINVWDLSWSAAAKIRLELAPGHNCLVIVQSGESRLQGESIHTAELARMVPGTDHCDLEASAPCRLLILTGEPLGEPIAGQGPFVMNTRDEIRQAIQDYQSGQMGRLA